MAVSFSAAVTGFDAGDVSVTNGVISGFTGTGTSYSFTVTPTTQGAVQINVADSAATDAATNASLASNVLNIVFDTVAPTLAFTSPAPASFVAMSNQTSFTVVGTCSENGRPVSIQSGVVTATPTCAAGAFSVALDLSSLSDGPVSIQATQTDAAGNAALPVNLNLVKDTVAPTATLAGLPSSPSKATTLDVTVSGASVVAYRFKVAASSILNCADSSGYSASVPVATKITESLAAIADGQVRLCVVGSDAAGNEQALASATSSSWAKDTIVAPFSGLTLTPASPGNDPRPVLNGSSEPLAVVELFAQASCVGSPVGSTTAAAVTGALSMSPASSLGSEGLYTLSARATDAAGNTLCSSSLPYELDTTPPPFTIASPSAGFMTNQGSITFSGTCTNGLPIQLSGAGLASPSSAACASGAYNVSVTLTAGEGAKTITLSQTDAASNTTSLSRSLTLDTTAPALTQTARATASSTNTNTVTFGGACEAGLNVTISGADSASATCASGSWTYTTESQTSDGSRAYTFTQTDAAGNSAVVNATWTRNTVPPNLTIASPAPGRSTNQSTAAFSGTCDNGLAIQLSGAGLASPSTATCSSGNFNVNVALTAGQGGKTITLAQTDALGNVASVSRTITLDTTPPTLTQTSQPSSVTTNTVSVTFGGACESGLSVVVSGEDSNSASCSAGVWTYTTALRFTDGVRVYTFTQIDAAGNTSSVNATWTRDVVAPNLTIAAPVAGFATNQSAVIFSGACESGITIILSGAGHFSPSLTACSGGSYSVSVTMTAGEGSKVIELAQTDAAGNTATVSRTVTRDTTPPVLTQTALAATSTSNTNTVTFGGACEDGANVVISGTDSGSTSCAAGAWTYATVSRTTDASRVYTFTQTDAAGNSSSVNATWIRDTVAPALTITSPANGLTTNQSTVTYEGTCEAGIGIQLSGAGLASPSATTCASGSYSVSVTLTAGDGSKTITLSQTDAAGNTGSISRAVTRDQTPPALLFGSVAIQTQTTNGNSVSFSGTCEAGLTIMVGGGVDSGSTSCASGTWSYTTVTRTTDANRSYSFTQTDAGGNGTTINGTWTRDTVAPALVWSTPSAGMSAQTQLIVTGTCESGRDIAYSGTGILSSFNAACSGGSFSQTLFFSSGEGTKTISIAQTDVAGNTTTVSRNFVRDNTPPALTQTLRAAVSFSSANTITFGGACESGLGVSVGGADTDSVTCSGSAWSYATPAKTSDGTYSYTFTQTDTAGNSQQVSAQFVRDTIAPSLGVSSTNPVVNAINSASFNGACESGVSISVTGTDTTSITCSGGNWSYTTATQSTNGTRTYSLTQTDAAGNATTRTLTWTRDTSVPNIQLDVGQSPSRVTSGDSITWTGTCQSGLNITVTGADSRTITCGSGTWSYTPPSQTSDGSRTYVLTQTNAIPLTSTLNLTWVRDTLAPVLQTGQMRLNSGASTTSSRLVSVALQAIDAGSKVSHFCLKTVAGSAPSAPTSADACWIAVNAPIPGLVLSQTLNLSGFSQPLDFTNGVYTVYAWVRDEVGNASLLSASGAGTSGLDRASITLNQGSPPVLTNVFAARLDSSVPPLAPSDEVVAAGQNLFIKWTASDPDETLGANAIHVYFTTNDSTWTEITTSGAIANAAGSGCSAAAGATGCLVWTAPTSGFMRVRVQATDSTGKIATTVGNALNTQPIRVLAGNTNSGLNADALTSVMFTDKAMNDGISYVNLFVVARNGDIYFADHQRGILRISAQTNLTSIFIPRGSSTTQGNGGPATAAGVFYPWKLALDPQDRLIIYDHNRIRRVNLNLATPTIENLIGGGVDTSDTVANPANVALQLGITANSDPNAGGRVPLIVAPNGNIYFRSEWGGNNFYLSPTSIRLRVYRVDLSPPRVESIFLSGQGVPGFPSQLLSECHAQQFGLAFSPLGNLEYIYGSASGGVMAGFANACLGGGNQHIIAFDPVTGVRSGAFPNLPSGLSTNSWRRMYSHAFTGRSGKIYVMSRSEGNLYRFDHDPSYATGGSFTRVVGNGSKGWCPDGGVATSCSFDLASAFVDENERIYLFDHDLIRLIRPDGTVQTLAGVRLNEWSTKLAINSRFGAISSVELDTTVTPTQLIAVDHAYPHLYRITIGGDTVNLAGGLFPGWPNTTSLANAQAFASSSGEHARPYVDPSTGDIFMHLDRPARLNKSTGRWEFTVGNGATSFNAANADGLAGSAISANPVSPFARWNNGVTIGFDGTRLLQVWDTIDWNTQIVQGVLFKLYDKSDSFRQSHLAGVMEVRSWSGADANQVHNFCADGVSTATCRVGAVGSPSYTRAYFDSVGNKWLVTKVGLSVIHVFNVGGNKTSLTLPHQVRNILYRRVGSQEMIFYCDNSQRRLYKQVIGGANTALTWPNPNMQCDGAQMALDESRGVLIFPYLLNGLSGIAETTEL